MFKFGYSSKRAFDPYYQKRKDPIMEMIERSNEMNNIEVFPLPLKAKYVSNGQWKLTASFKYVNPPIKIEVPAGFISDGASIPKSMYSIIGAPWGGEYSKAAVIHDYTYSCHMFTRHECDKIFYIAMGVLGVSNWKRSLMHFAVRCAGWIPWKKRGGK